MITLLILCCDKQEREFIEGCAHRQILRLTDDYCSYNVFSSSEQAAAFLEESDRLDMALISLTDASCIEAARNVRKKYKNTFILLFAPPKLSPERYVEPSLVPDAMLLRRERPEGAEEGIKRLFDWYYKNIHCKDDKACYCFKGKEGRIMIEYQNIAYFESREKRIVLCTDNEEFYFYDTIENIALSLPQSFLRCHRSFIVNTSRIKSVRLSDNCVFLDNGFIVPVSRSYKSALKERLG